MDLFSSKSPLIELDPPENLKFVIDKSKTHSEIFLTIKNNASVSTAYKIKTSSPEFFEINPSSQIISGEQEIQVKIRFRISIVSLEKFHKFLLQAVIVDDVNNIDWKSNGVHEYKLFAKFIDIQDVIKEKVPVIEEEKKEENIQERILEAPRVERKKKGPSFISGFCSGLNKSRFSYVHLLGSFICGSVASYYLCSS
ncbi:hypothetical protein SteCoe_33340 [Stentor coeruleus]|uniref:MSP domain-containing protein n=1 Tax=Stentor coeruleus TaxID=5963 RepID=A0A1R2AX02_9CILI|nr:hypothetical protein SteCoe_33340 [Stentor coeruleus]